jgi:hypothetical protein
MSLTKSGLMISAALPQIHVVIDGGPADWLCDYGRGEGSDVADLRNRVVFENRRARW